MRRDGCVCVSACVAPDTAYCGLPAWNFLYVFWEVFLWAKGLFCVWVGPGQSKIHSLALSEELLGWEGQFFAKKKIVVFCKSCLEQSSRLCLALIFSTPQNQAHRNILGKWKGLEEGMENLCQRGKLRRKNFNALGCTPGPQHFLPHMH